MFVKYRCVGVYILRINCSALEKPKFLRLTKTSRYTNVFLLSLTAHIPTIQDGRTAYDLANGNGHTQVCELLHDSVLC